MLQIFPFAVWLAILTSAVLLVVQWKLGELAGRRGTVLAAWFLVAGYFQLFGASAAAAVVGLVLQTILAIYLILRWKLSA